MLQIDLWKRILIVATCAIGLFLALPNAFYTRVETHNDALKALSAAEQADQTGAAVSTDWPRFLPSALVNLGLDLRGGAHLLAEVQVSDVYATRMQAMWPEVRNALRAERAVIGTIRLQPSEPDRLVVKISQPEGTDRAIEVVRSLARPVVSVSSVGETDIVVSAQDGVLQVQLSEAEKLTTDGRTVKRALEIIRRRIDEVGTREPTIQRQGTSRILIQVPGIGSASELKAIIGTTAQLTFQPVVGRASGVDAPA